MPNMDEKEPDGFRQRVRDAIQGVGMTELSSITGIPVSTLNKYVAMTSAPSATNAGKISRAANMSLDSLVTGVDFVGQIDGKTLLLQAKSNPDIVRLPRFEVSASAGAGLIAIDQMPAGEVGFERKLIHRLGGSPEHCYLIEARGDSMWPTIADGATLIADASQRDVDDGRIYHFNVNDRVLVKRARWHSDRLFLTSDNLAAGYQDESFSADRVHELYVGGRIIFVGQAPLPPLSRV